MDPAIIEKAKELALEEIDKTGLPNKEHWELSNQKGQELAIPFEDVDKDVVLLGTILMDLKLGECFHEKKLGEHCKRSSKAAKEFLLSYEIEQEIMNKVLHCIEAHHKWIPFTCKEAEICANADCYRFLHPKGIFIYLTLLGKRVKEIDEAISQVKAKMHEKKNILTLDICKEELMPYYEQFSKLFDECE